MARINTNVPSMIARQNLAQTNQDLQVRLQRLSTGLRINRGADDPAGLIISERMRSEISGLGQAIDNAERASNVLATGEASLAEVADLLNSIKALTIEAANDGAISREEIEANQLQIDSAVDSITRIANTTTFAGLKLLNGSLDYLTSGVASSAISDVNVFSANFGTSDTLPVNVEVVENAEKGELFASTGNPELDEELTLEIAGARGVEVLNFAEGTALSAVSFAVNRSSDATGVTAEITSGEGGTGSAVRFFTTEFGSDQFVSVTRVPGSGGDFFKTFDELGGSGQELTRDSGEDVAALINGNLAVGKGTNISLNSSSLKLDMALTDDYATAAGTAKSFHITGGGANFQLGPRIESSQQVGFGIQSIAANRLGNATVGFLSSIVSGGENALTEGGAAAASRIIDEAVTQVAVMRGRLGSFERNTLQTNVRSLQISLENLTASESRIRDTDFAEEISKLNRAQVLTNVGTSVLGTANNSAANVLSLLQ